MSAERLFARAERAIASAKVLLQDGDSVGACDRAYYAMFDAARAALVTLSERIATQAERSHGGLISAFGRHFVKSGMVPAELGRQLGRNSLGR